MILKSLSNNKMFQELKHAAQSLTRLSFLTKPLSLDFNIKYPTKKLIISAFIFFLIGRSDS